VLMSKTAASCSRVCTQCGCVCGPVMKQTDVSGRGLLIYRSKMQTVMYFVHHSTVTASRDTLSCLFLPLMQQFPNFSVRSPAL
jgi:hypothetical protein